MHKKKGMKIRRVYFQSMKESQGSFGAL